MKITKESQQLMSFFVNHNCVLTVKHTNKTNELLKKLFAEITNGVSYIHSLKQKLGSAFYKLNINHITTAKQIPTPSTFGPNAFPVEIRKHIDEYLLNSLTYSFHIFNRKITIIFVTEDANIEHHIETFNTYVDNLLVWLYIVNEYSSKSCSTELKIYIYHTSLLKVLPASNVNILDVNNVNTAFTRTCLTKSEIVVYRKEEWFKVFLHETFHNFGLDFSDLNMVACHLKILSIFKVNSEVNLFEAYAEFWARLMNTLFCSYNSMKNKSDIQEFLTNAEFFINFERIFAFFQMVKVLNFMDIQYKDLYENNADSEIIRKTMYRENTNVLSYYIITLVLLNNYQDFLFWCNANNTSFIQFKKTETNLSNFCAFIGKKYKTKSILDGIQCTERLLQKVVKQKQQHKHLGYLIKNLRMTICELG